MSARCSAEIGRSGARPTNARPALRARQPQLLAQDLLHDLVGAAADRAQAGVADHALKALLDDEDFRARAGELVMGSIYDTYRTGAT